MLSVFRRLLERKEGTDVIFVFLSMCVLIMLLWHRMLSRTVWTSWVSQAKPSLLCNHLRKWLKSFCKKKELCWQNASSYHPRFITSCLHGFRRKFTRGAVRLSSTTCFNLKDQQEEPSWVPLQCWDLEIKSHFHWWEVHYWVQWHRSHSLGQ